MVSDYNGDSVKIQVSGGASAFGLGELGSEDREKAQTLADVICQRGHRKSAEYVSEREVPNGQYSSYRELMYLCLE